ncbi:MAG: (2Fe-2S)-binding protein [Alphaproteobacteria bacterium]|mgnify:FL=1|nr:(2Fe-2S)-binding protein [Alphaproteobacteria bacterium]MDC3311531.1 (2Fe-2S)-binding protein [Alphaproteobacteria bacterium]
MAEINLTVNGKNVQVDTDPDTPLIYILRNDLNYTGAKLGCALEQCGACMVLVDGEPTNSCVRAAAEFEGMQIETVEGFGTPDKMSEVQQVFAEENVAQCGYCTAGIVTSVTAMFRKNPNPSDEYITETLNRHLCRCGSHSRIIDAVNRLRTGAKK